MLRIFDIFLSGIAILMLIPFFIPIILILKLTGEGEVFYTQNRVGSGGKIFKLYKFATMLKDSENIGTGTITIHNDPRILPFGRLLRKTKINELPQLFNVFKGNMSVIGPRPQEMRCFNAFPKSSQRKIITVKPGLSGIGSVIFRNEENMMKSQADPDFFYDKSIMPYKGLLEEWYVSNQSIKIYFYLIIFTVWTILYPKSRLIWSTFKTLPKPPKELQKWI